MNEKEYLERRKNELNAELREIMQRTAELGKNEIGERNRRHPPRMMTIKEAARETHLAENYIRYLCRNEQIVFVKAGNKYLVNYEKLLEYLNGEGGE